MLYFGYGSLVNRQTRDSSERFQTATLQGWERRWAHRATRRWQQQSGQWQSDQHLGALSSTQTDSHSEGLLVRGSGVCALTISQSKDVQIDGVLAEIDDDHLTLLDQREAGYSRLMVPATDFSFNPGQLAASVGDIATGQVCVYVSLPQNNDWANRDYPVTRSYVDCVLAGFLQQFSVSGARRFMQSTIGWDKPLYDDRLNPLYPRAVTLLRKERELVDQLLTDYTG